MLALVLAGAIVGCGGARERRSESLIEALPTAQLHWDQQGGEEGTGLQIVPRPGGPIVQVSLGAEENWTEVKDAASWMRPGPEDVKVWSLGLTLPSVDPEATSLLLDGRPLETWNRPAAPRAHSWFYAAGGFLKTGLYLALPSEETPSQLDLAVQFPPSERLLLDLLGPGGNAAAPQELRGRVRIGELSRTSIYLPNRSSLSFSLHVPPAGRLRLHVGRVAFPWVASPPPSTVSIDVDAGDGWHDLDRIEFVAGEGAQSTPSGEGGGWRDVDVDLGAYANQAIRLRFVAPNAAGVGKVAHYLADPTVVASWRGSSRPNLIILVADGVRADRRPWAGKFPDLMPHLDRIAAHGLEFTQMRSAAPWTRASIASLFTGWLPSRHGAETEGDRDRLPASVPTLAAELQRHGYATAAFSANPHLDPVFGLSRGFSVVESRLQDGAELNRSLIGYLKQHPYAPFFLFGFYMDTHYPYKDREEYHDADDIKAPTEDVQRLGRGLDRARRGVAEPTKEEVARLQALYDENVRYTDARVGEVMESLNRLGLNRNTIVIFLADHGEGFGEHGDFFHGWSLFDELLRMPLIVSGPGVPSGRRLDQPVSLRSLPALVLHWLHLDDDRLADPEEAERILSGRPARQPVIAETRFRGSNLAAILEWPWKLILARDSGQVELYDLAQDPGEHHNLAPKQGERVDRMRAELNRWLREAEARRVKPQAGEQLQRLDKSTLDQLKSLGYVQ